MSLLVKDPDTFFSQVNQTSKTIVNEALQRLKITQFERKFIGNRKWPILHLSYKCIIDIR